MLLITQTMSTAKPGEQADVCSRKTFWQSCPSRILPHGRPARAQGLRKGTGARDRGGEVAKPATLLRLQKAFQLAAQTSVPVLSCIHKT